MHDKVSVKSCCLVSIRQLIAHLKTRTPDISSAANISALAYHRGMPDLICGAAALQSLTQNELRERVILRADGGMRSGKDVMLAAALGADEYGFGTVAMIATGCIMARVCHTNNCPVGVASQREELRARFPWCSLLTWCAKTPMFKPKSYSGAIIRSL